MSSIASAVFFALDMKANVRLFGGVGIGREERLANTRIIGARSTFVWIGDAERSWGHMLMLDAIANGSREGLEGFVALTSTNPARLYGLAPRKGHICVEADADLVVWNASAERLIDDSSTSDKTGFTPFAGRKVRGVPETVARRGEVLVRDGVLRASAGIGRLLARPPFVPVVL